MEATKVVTNEAKLLGALLYSAFDRDGHEAGPLFAEAVRQIERALDGYNDLRDHMGWGRAVAGAIVEFTAGTPFLEAANDGTAIALKTMREQAVAEISRALNREVKDTGGVMSDEFAHLLGWQL